MADEQTFGEQRDIQIQHDGTREWFTTIACLNWHEKLMFSTLLSAVIDSMGRTYI